MRREEERDNRGIWSILLILLLIFFVIVLSVMLFTKNSKEDGCIGVNVTTGKLKVDIVDEEQTSLVGDVLDFVDPDGDGKLYFEPGATFYTQGFQVKNVGELLLAYTISVSEDENIDKAEFEAAFEFWLSTDPTNMEEAVKLQTYEGTLNAEESSETYYIVVKMKETAGNEYQDKSYTGIGITVHAVQSAAKE